MHFRILRGLPILGMLVAALGVGVTAHAAPAVNMAKLCSNGAYVLYMDDNGDQFASEAACVAWTRQHPGKPPIAIDDDPDGHPDQTADVDPDTSDDQPADVSTDDPDDQTGDAPDAVSDNPDDQSSGRVMLVVVTDPTDDGATVTDDSDSSDDGSAVTDDDSGDESVVIGDDSGDGEG